MQKQLIKEKLRIDLRAEYGHTLLRMWQGRSLSAAHVFCDSDDGSIILNFTGGPVIQSEDGGKTWGYYRGIRKWPSSDTGMFRQGDYLFALYNGCRYHHSVDGGMTWGPERLIPSVKDVHFSEIGDKNYFTAMMTLEGRIVVAGDYSLGKPDVDADVICVASTGDWGASWEFSRLFGPADPLPKAPEGFAEPAIAEMPNGYLWMVCRALYGELWQCISQDGGLTWNEPTPTGLASPISNCYAKRLPGSGATVLCWNFVKPGPSTRPQDSPCVYRPRTNLVFAVSHDNCRTWSCPVLVEEYGGEYPTIHFTKDDMFIMYQSNPDEKIRPWGNRGLTLVRYDKKEVDSLPAWTTETIQPYIDSGLVAHWLAISCDQSRQKVIR